MQATPLDEAADDALEVDVELVDIAPLDDAADEDALVLDAPLDVVSTPVDVLDVAPPAPPVSGANW